MNALSRLYDNQIIGFEHFYAREIWSDSGIRRKIREHQGLSSSIVNIYSIFNGNLAGIYFPIQMNVYINVCGLRLNTETIYLPEANHRSWNIIENSAQLSQTLF